jgi:hypothetical protein
MPTMMPDNGMSRRSQSHLKGFKAFGAAPMFTAMM